MSAEQRAEVSPDWLARARNAPAPDPWMLGFALLDRRDGHLIGRCGFKGPPDANGIVEIAYGVEPIHEGKGYATEAAAALLDYAFGTQEVRTVCAHTRLSGNASARILTKCGFTCVGEGVDPEDGPVWRWEKHR